MSRPEQEFWKQRLRAFAKGPPEPGGIVLGVDEAGERVAMDSRQRDRGLYIIGLPGNGKSTLIENCVLQDIRAGHGVAVLTPEAESFTENILPFIPKDRIKDVIYIDPLDAARPIPLNPLHLLPGEPLSRAVADFMTIFRRVVGEGTETSAPRMMFILRNAVRTLMQIPGSNLFDIEALLDLDRPEFRLWAVQRVDDPRLRQFWTNRYPRLAKESAHSVWSRIEPFLEETVSSVLCVRGQRVDFFEQMDANRILLFNLQERLGEDAQAVLGQFVVAQFQLATLRRPMNHPRPFYVYIDEFQTFANASVASYEKMLSRARKRRAPLILAHQFLRQLTEPVMDGIFGTVSTTVAFGVGDHDARRLAREMHLTTDGKVDPHLLRFLPVGRGYCRMSRVLHRFKTLPPPQGGSRETAEAVIRHSRDTFGAMPTARSPHPGGAALPTRQTSTALDDIDPGEVF